LKRALALIIPTLASVAIMTTTHAETFSFDRDAPGALPAGWRSGVTGRGSPKWSVEAEPSAPSKPNVLKQAGSGTFPWCVRPDVSLADGYVEVKFKPLSGREDRAGGVVWRWKDGDNYYVARANALEDNVSLYYTANGRRNTLKYAGARERLAYAAGGILRQEDTRDLRRQAIHRDGRRSHRWRGRSGRVDQGGQRDAVRRFQLRRGIRALRLMGDTDTT
jgi:hypothetical protein